MGKKIITFDVMLRDRFVCTLRMPLTFDIITGYEGDKPVIPVKAFEQFVERKRPTLKSEPYKIFI